MSQEGGCVGAGVSVSVSGEGRGSWQPRTVHIAQLPVAVAGLCIVHRASAG